MMDIYITDNSILIWQIVLVVNLGLVVYSLSLIIKDHIKRKLNMVSIASLLLVFILPIIGPCVYVYNYRRGFKKRESLA